MMAGVQESHSGAGAVSLRGEFCAYTLGEQVDFAPFGFLHEQHCEQ